jgi:hypothetical protein
MIVGKGNAYRLLSNGFLMEKPEKWADAIRR